MNNIDLGRYKRMIQYFWDAEPKNEEGPGSKIWCLGNEYVTPEKDEFPAGSNSNINAGQTADSSRNTAPENIQIHDSKDHRPSKSDNQDPTTTDSAPTTTETAAGTESTKSLGWPKAFLDDFECRIWMTYRSGFPPIARSEDANAAQAMTLSVRLRSQLTEHHQGFTSDTGWGCMIRSGQSLLANALAISRLGRDWRRGSNSTEENRLLSLFADDPAAPFSIHKFVRHGALYCGKHPGEWFGPSATATCIQALSDEYKDAGMNVYVSSDNTYVYEDKFKAVAYNQSDRMRPTLILLGTRLGIDRITPVYRKGLEDLLKLPQALGIAGGRPSASHYFIGVQNSFFFYLDPHHTRPALPYKTGDLAYTQEEIDSCHTRRLRRIHIDDMDPSMLVGFLIRDENDWMDWKRRITSSRPENGKAIIHIVDTKNVPTPTMEREAALDEVEVLDDDEDSELV
ncbi:autophagy cysteine endopeptidase Atg4, putative [Talaromyces stipitatus ATCC 10500]|uniref:Cysteine protease n=1 Tax=Talaromyces stipitatus (strain ATCC 10500 / CBS 375.48 / QM 6759 / NRRL 1006) TaxID=441959 RepID=B8MNS4_TALSN|nr:autophagy cysteine endopeptidase Atg4, putative [Talaromyces stipitatus ATCC 10500]EED14163.1 autophagy cysteine endopeptidase Atg4, putative [Talaromyces stipitatus ATCC 10500]